MILLGLKEWTLLMIINGDDEDENNDDQGKIAEILPDEDPIQAETNEERSDTVEEESLATDAHCKMMEKMQRLQET